MAKIDYSRITNQQKLIIDEFIDNFEFEKVHEHMVNTHWVWATGNDKDNVQYAVPNIAQLKHHLRSMIVDAYVKISKHPELKESPYMISCGGFTVFVWPDDACHVFFSIAEMDVDREYIEFLEY